jgi:hypothetical protein
MENPLRQNFFRAGHAHAGVIVILSLVCQMLADAAVLPSPLLWVVRIGVPLAAILFSSGFFFSVLPPTGRIHFRKLFSSEPILLAVRRRTIHVTFTIVIVRDRPVAIFRRTCEGPLP